MNVDEFQKELINKISNDEKTFLLYFIDCCENILGKQVLGIGYPKAEKKYGLTPPILQLMKMNHELKIRLDIISSNKKDDKH